MKTLLHILLVEDAALDAELTLSKLSEAGLRFEAVRVDTEEGFRHQIVLPELLLILSDYVLPGFTGLAALRIAREARPDVPFIFVSGALGEDNVVDMLKEGATDYVLKHRLDRLLPAVKRALQEVEERNERHRVETELKQERLRAEEQRESLLASERAARAEAERASRTKDEFLASLSHELRTPLNAIVGWSQILKTMRNLNPDVLEGLEVIERNARVQARIIDDLLDMSRITSGKIKLECQEVNLAGVIAAAIESVRPSADEKHVCIEKTIDPIIGLSRGDPGRLQQVLWNLLTNAIKFTPGGGQINVRLARADSHVEISVSDSGVGIKPEFLPYVFDRFRQEDASISRNYGGLGLGLAIVKQLTEMHGGTVRAMSDGPGRGATFIVRLPMSVGWYRQATESQAGNTAAQQLVRLDGPRLDGLRVLIVDDEFDARRMVKRMLEEWGAKVFIAASAREGLDRVRSETLDMVISDIGMPDCDGYEFMRQVRGLVSRESGKLPTVALTAFATADDRRKALAAGFDMHMAKPIDRVQLGQAVGRLTKRSASVI